MLAVQERVQRRWGCQRGVWRQGAWEAVACHPCTVQAALVAESPSWAASAIKSQHLVKIPCYIVPMMQHQVFLTTIIY